MPIHPEQVLVVSGKRDELITSGASMTWHDLVLYLIARHAGATAAQTIARAFALQWHQDGLAPYMVFEGRRDHGHAAVQAAQDWLADHFSGANPLEEMIRRAGLAERTFKRRFTQATGLSPIAYVQRLRVEEAKRRLERTEASVDEISWLVGYEEPAFFRRLFRRVTGLPPSNYRRRFQMPNYAKPSLQRDQHQLLVRAKIVAEEVPEVGGPMMVARAAIFRDDGGSHRGVLDHLIQMPARPGANEGRG